MTRVMSVWRNGRNCNNMFIFLLIILACKELTWFKGHNVDGSRLRKLCCQCTRVNIDIYFPESRNGPNRDSGLRHTLFNNNDEYKHHTRFTLVSWKYKQHYHPDTWWIWSMLRDPPLRSYVTTGMETSWEGRSCIAMRDMQYNFMLTHCGLVTPYGDINLGQHWLR